MDTEFENIITTQDTNNVMISILTTWYHEAITDKVGVNNDSPGDDHETYSKPDSHCSMKIWKEKLLWLT